MMGSDWRELAEPDDAMRRWPNVASFCRRNCYDTVHHIDCAAWLWDAEGRARLPTVRSEVRSEVKPPSDRDTEIRACRENGETLDSIGKKHGLTRERIRQIISGTRGNRSIIKTSLGKTRTERKARFKQLSEKQ